MLIREKGAGIAGASRHDGRWLTPTHQNYLISIIPVAWKEVYLSPCLVVMAAAPTPSRGSVCISSFLRGLDDQRPSGSDSSIFLITNNKNQHLPMLQPPGAILQMHSCAGLTSLEIGPAPAQNRDCGLALSACFVIPFSRPPFIPGFYVPPTGIHRGLCPPIADVS